MAKTKIVFNNKNYNIDEASFATATAALKSHLSTVMNGSGATIKFGGTSYNIDQTKLSTATNEFVTHLGKIAGNGSKVNVGGIEYSIDSDKISGPISDLEAILGGLISEDNDFPAISENTTWDVKTWNGCASFDALHVWFYEGNMYVTIPNPQNPDYIFNKETDAWEPITWNWSVQVNPRYSPGKPFIYKHKLRRGAMTVSGVKDFVFNKETNTWEVEDLDSDYMSFDRDHTFTYGEDIYASSGTILYKFNRETEAWELWKETIWNESYSYVDSAVWFYKGNVYYSMGTNKQFVLNQETNVWEPKIWNGYTDLYGTYFWGDGKHVYYIEDKNISCILNPSTETWERVTWKNYPTGYEWRKDLWTDGENIYCSIGSKQYVLVW